MAHFKCSSEHVDKRDTNLVRALSRARDKAPNVALRTDESSVFLERNLIVCCLPFPISHDTVWLR